jgi:hypothetical protein
MEARTLTALGRLVEAANKYSLAQLMNDPKHHNEAYRAAIAAAAQEAQALEPRIPLVRVQLVGDLATGTVEVWIDGRKLPDVLVGVDNPLDPGRHRVEVRPTGGSLRAREFEIAEGEHETLRFGTTLPEPVPAPTPVAAPLPPAKRLEVDEPPSAADTAAGDPVPWLVLGAGAAATAVGVASGIAALSKQSDLDEAGCEDGCAPKYKNDIRSYRRYRALSYAGFGFGLVGLGWGGYLIVSPKSGDGEVGVRITPNGARLDATF